MIQFAKNPTLDKKYCIFSNVALRRSAVYECFLGVVFVFLVVFFFYFLNLSSSEARASRDHFLRGLGVFFLPLDFHGMFFQCVQRLSL